MRPFFRSFFVVSALITSHFSIASKIDVNWQLNSQHTGTTASDQSIVAYKTAIPSDFIASNFSLDFSTLNEALLSTNDQFELSIPLPNGSLVDFVLSYARVTHPELSRKSVSYTHLTLPTIYSV